MRESADALAIALHANFGGATLMDAVHELGARADTVRLPNDARGFWAAGLRVENIDDAKASARNVVARAHFLDSAMAARELPNCLAWTISR